VADILLSFGLSFVMAAGVYVLGLVLPFNMLCLLITQILAGTAFIFLFCEIVKFNDYIFVKELVIEKIREIQKNE